MVALPPTPRALLLSLRPQFSNLVLDGRKSLELRRRASTSLGGIPFILYETGPTFAVVGCGWIQSCVRLPLDALWERAKDDAGVSRSEFDAYFSGLTVGNALKLTNVQRFEQPTTLSDLRRDIPDFVVPQSYRFVKDAERPFLAAGWEVGPHSST